jgi:predicted RNA binding protein YcfA (HicA-like mRNA interferase family)
LTTQEVVKRLRDDGWTQVKQVGSHRKYRHAEKPGMVTVPMHKGDIPKGTLASIFRQAGWKNEP